MEMKGSIFSIDAIIAIALLLFILTIFPKIHEYGYGEIISRSMLYAANDLINSLSNLKAKYYRTKTINELLKNGTLKEVDLEKSLLDLIGSLWYSGKKDYAKKICLEILNELNLSYCINLTTLNETICSTCNRTGKIVATSSILLSGYEVGKPTSGYIARAWVRKYRKNSTLILPFYPEGSGWRGRKLEVYKRFWINPEMIILKATLYVSVHFGTEKSQAQFEHLMVNGAEKKNDIEWLYMEELAVGTEITTAAFGYVDVTNEIKEGENEIYLALGSPHYHSHIHPGMRLVIVYSLVEEPKESERFITKRFYFDNVIGRSGAWSTISFYIPENAKNISAKIRLNLKNVEDTKVFLFNSTDIKIYVNSEEPFFEDGTTDLCYAISRYYCYRDIVATKDVNLTFDISSMIKNGTNIVSVYVNCYGDLHWGDSYAEIYSDPINNPNSSSYVEISYWFSEPLIKYGEIDLTREDLLGGEIENPKIYSFNLTKARSDIIESFVHIAQGFSSMTEVYAWFDDQEKQLVFKSPAPRAVPESVYIYPSIWKVGENFIELRDVQPGGSLSPTNKFLPWSSFEYTYKIEGMVGYDGVFNSSEEAINDAINRLIEKVGSEEVSVEDLEVDYRSVYGIEWLWGPAEFKIIVWKL